MKRNRGLAGLLQGLSRRQLLQTTGAAAVGISVAGLPDFASAEEEKKLVFYNWDTYIDPDALDEFTEATGIEITMDLFADTAELFAKLKEGNQGYDVIVPSNDWVPRMVAADMIQPLDHAKIPNLKYMFPRFMDVKFDPGRKYSIPYMWGTVGVGYRKSRVDGPPDSWKYLYDSDKYAGKIALLSDCGTMIACGLRYLGYDVDDIDPKHNAEVTDMLIKQKKYIKTFAEDNGQDLLASGEVDLAMEYNGDIAQLMTEDDDIGFIIPKEGGIIWEDTLCVPTGAPHPDNAHKFINFIYEPKVNAQIAEFIQYATPNEAAYKLMPAGYRDNPAIYPPAAALDASQEATYVGEEGVTMRDELCTKMEAA